MRVPIILETDLNSIGTLHYKHHDDLFDVADSVIIESKNQIFFLFLKKSLLHVI